MFSLILTALSDGAARAVVEAQSSFPDGNNRAQYLVGAAQVLIQLREYERALELTKAAARAVNIPGIQARLELLGKVKRSEQVLLPPTDPR
ncbi:MAG TPA: hypothetical protein VE398_11980, partial [Acidobacteriota bacterium]|nr:hypothetical protein [Acidobacteriota bacterium]